VQGDEGTLKYRRQSKAPPFFVFWADDGGPKKERNKVQMSMKGILGYGGKQEKGAQSIKRRGA